LLGPAGTPQSVINYLHKESVAVLSQPDIVARLAMDGATPIGDTPQAFGQSIRDDIVRWAKVIKAAGIKL
jgi:tripartite-type tricarboxylate transporter receptor subunit TctC